MLLGWQSLVAQVAPTPPGTTVVDLALKLLLVLAPLFGGVFALLPRGGREGNRWFGAGLVTLGLVLLITIPLSGSDGVPTDTQATAFWSLPSTLSCYSFHALAGVSLLAAVFMITARNPVYSALWFSLVLLSNSGLYLLQRAEFLSASTLIVYAGAIVVMFLFVIMLAQPNGAAPSDRVSREPLLASVTGLGLAAVLVATLHVGLRAEGNPPGIGAAQRPAASTVALQVAATPASQIDPAPETHVRGLGKTLFIDHVVSVEITGLLLLAAVVGALLIAGHRIEDTHARK